MSQQYQPSVDTAHFESADELELANMPSDSSSTYELQPDSRSVSRTVSSRAANVQPQGIHGYSDIDLAMSHGQIEKQGLGFTGSQPGQETGLESIQGSGSESGPKPGPGSDETKEIVPEIKTTQSKQNWLKRMLTKTVPEPLPRTLYFNQPLPPDQLGPTGLPKQHFGRNKIRTTKYTPVTFIPLNLFYQFHNVANIFFLFIAILSQFEIFGVGSPGLAVVPIIVIVVITAIRDAIEDYRRATLDLELNNTVTHVLTGVQNHNVVEDNVSSWRKFKKLNTRALRVVTQSLVKLVFKAAKKRPDPALVNGPRPSLDLRSIDTRQDSLAGDRNTSFEAARLEPVATTQTQAKFQRVYWKAINAGDVIKVYNNEEFPSDMVILSTSDDDGACFIETKNLDGETNLKSRQSLRATQGITHAKDLVRAQFEVESEAPNQSLYTYSGVLRYDRDQQQRSEAVTNNNLLLRGCSLRNTKWVIGLVVFTGRETKVMLNSGATPAKRSRLSRELNFNVVCNFLFLFILALIAGILEGVYWRRVNTSANWFEFGSTGGSAAVDGLITFWAAAILLQNLIPISLYISIEIVKSLQAFFIYSDYFMYYEDLDYPCTPKSWTISDDLGQIEYIFSDKTGTLTQNVMEFRKCSVNGVPYGMAFTEAQVGMLKMDHSPDDVEAIARSKYKEVDDDRQQMVSLLTDSIDNPELDTSRLQFVSSAAVRDMLGSSNQSAAMKHFFLALALCHEVLPERKDGRLLFKAQSPDEEALVQTASDMGYTLVDRTRDTVVLVAHGQRMDIKVLRTIQFSSARRRMSVIVELDGQLVLLTKGADTAVYQRLTEASSSSELQASTSSHLEQFASEGLRTLCVAQKQIDPAVYAEWSKRYDVASQALENREEQMEVLADEMERGLTLIGGTAIEDRLQEGVPASIATLGRAGIKLWVLTGDKVGTAINIGYSCNLLEADMELLVVKLKDFSRAAVEVVIDGFLQRFDLSGTVDELTAAKADHSPAASKFALVIDGDALAFVLDSDEGLRRKFVLLGKQCKSVLCCRVSPSQKAAVVRLVKTTLDVMTLAIGDGANDVAMIQEADVGVGIAGVEGRQAVMSSDYAVGQFRFLVRLMLVHGRYAYRRICELTANLFYKNVVFTLTLFWYDVHNSFDGSYLYDYTYITLFNLVFTSLPVIFMGFLDKDVSPAVSVAVPQLYQRGILRKEWTQAKFWYYMVDGVYQSVVCYFFGYLCFFNGGFQTANGLGVSDRVFLGVFVATPAIAACNMYVTLNEYQWDWLFMVIVSISTALVFFWTGVYSSFPASSLFYQAGARVYSSLPFWANTLLAIVTCLLPRFSGKAFQKMYMPRDIDIVREQVIRNEFSHLADESQFGREGRESQAVADIDTTDAAEVLPTESTDPAT